MNILYYDCFCGISGDMNLGAMVDLGVDTEYLKSELNKLSIKDEFEIKFDKEIKNGISGTKAYVIMNKHDHVHRHLRHIDEIIDNSPLSEFVKAKSKDMFRVIAKAEGKVHGKSMEAVHFHEVGAIDSIVDIVGAAICLEELGVDRIYSSPVQLGGGFVNCAHGTIPVPAPATVEILNGVPVKTGLVESETTTPTGAAILTSAVKKFTDKIEMNIIKIGYGLGTKDFEVPNVLRVYLAEI